MAGRFTGGDHLTEKNGLKYTLHKTLMVTELVNGMKAYELSNAQKAESGPSFGATQYDLGVSTHGRKLFESVATQAKNAEGELIISNKELVDIKLHLYKPFVSMTANEKQLYADLKPKIDAALSSATGKELIHADYEPELNRQVAYVNEIVAGVTNSKNKQYLETSLVAQTILADTANQYGSVGPQFREFLNQTSADAGVRGVKVEGDFDEKDLLNFKLSFRFAKEGHSELVKARHDKVLNVVTSAIQAPKITKSTETQQISELAFSKLQDDLVLKEMFIAELEQRIANLTALTAQVPDQQIEKPDLKIDLLEVENKEILLTMTESGMSFNINGKDHDASYFNQLQVGITDTQSTYRNETNTLLAKYEYESDQFSIFHKNPYTADKIAVISDFSEQNTINLVSFDAVKTQSLEKQKSLGKEC